MALHPKGFDLSLDRISRLLERLGNPAGPAAAGHPYRRHQRQGLGRRLLPRAARGGGYSVHVHTSPHLVNWHERYRLAARGGGRLVADEVSGRAMARVAEANDGETITVFEILTAVDLPAVFRASGRCGDHRGRPRRPLRRHQCHRTTRRCRVIMPVSLDHEAYPRRPRRADRRREGRHHQARAARWWSAPRKPRPRRRC